MNVQLGRRARFGGSATRYCQLLTADDPLPIANRKGLTLILTAMYIT